MKLTNSGQFPARGERGGAGAGTESAPARGKETRDLGAGKERGSIPAPWPRRERGKRYDPVGVKAPPPRHLRVGRGDPLPRAGPALEIHFSPLGLRGNVRFRLIRLYYFSSALLRCFPAFLVFSLRNFGEKRCLKKGPAFPIIPRHPSLPMNISHLFRPGHVKKRDQGINTVQKQRENSGSIDHNINWIWRGATICVFSIWENVLPVFRRRQPIAAPEIGLPGMSATLSQISFPISERGRETSGFYQYLAIFFSTGARGQEFAGQERRGKTRKLRSEPSFHFLHQNVPDTCLRLG